MLSLILFLLGAAGPTDPSLLQPAELAARLNAKSGKKPTLIHVGFGFLYRGKHLPGSVYAGPGARPEGLKALQAAVAKLPRDGEIVIYCGCCPWTACPNIKPALEALRSMGFTKVKALYIPTNLAKDWTEKGYPVENGPAAP
jgi:rhodanese-related sulfurtransferase